MTIYDVVQIVSPGCKTSRKQGRWWVRVTSFRDVAEQFAEKCNEHAYEGISYRVEEHDEESSDRAPEHPRSDS